MYDDDDVLIALAAFIIIASKQIKSLCKWRFWVRPSLCSGNRYRASDLITDLLLDNVEILNLEYRCNDSETSDVK